MANTYDTSGEPLGSTSAKVLYNNASNFDEALNAFVQSWIDRFGRNRKTWYGFEQDFNTFLVSSGFEPIHLVYTVGTPLSVARATQLIDYNGSVYRVKMPATFPVALTGVWAADSAKLVDVGDTSLRQDLASTANTSVGGGMVGLYAGTVYTHVREKLQGARTYYVRMDGSDSNNGRANTNVGAFLTIQRAVREVMNRIDLNGNNIVIQVADGTYNDPVKVLSPWVGQGLVEIVGNVGVPSNCLVSVNDAQGVFYGEKSAAFNVRGFAIYNAGGDGVSSQSSAFINAGAMEYRYCQASQLVAGGQAFLYLSANYSITQGGGSSHLHTGSPGLIFAGDITCTITNNPAYSAYFAGAANGSIVVKGITFTGAAQGARYLAHKHGIVETHPGYNPALPGTIEGREATGGGYVGSTEAPYTISTNTASGASLNLQAFEGVTQTFRKILSMVTDPSGTGRGYLYVNGAGSYLSNMTHLGTDQQVQASAGTNDGITVSQGGELNSSRPNALCAYWRRRLSDGQIMAFYRDTTQSGAISVTAGATTYGTTSDYRLKKDVVPLIGALDRLDKLRPVRFEMISEPGKVVDGFIAHEVSEVVPNAVVGEKDAMREFEGEQVIDAQVLDPSKMVALLTAALQELNTKFEAYVATHP